MRKKYQDIYDLFLEEQPNELQLKNDFEDFFKVENKLPKISTYKNKVILVEGSEILSYLKWTELVHSKIQEDELFSIRKNYEKDNIKPIFSNDNVDVYEAENKIDCYILGKGYPFCISKENNGMWQSYRDSYSSNFYFIFDKTRKNNDPLHLVVVDVRKNNNIKLTDVKNTTGHISVFEENVEGYFDYLKSLNVEKSIFKEKPLSELEIKFSKLSKANDDFDWFDGLSVVEKEHYIERENPLTDLQFESIFHIKPLVKKYVNCFLVSDKNFCYSYNNYTHGCNYSRNLFYNQVESLLKNNHYRKFVLKRIIHFNKHFNSEVHYYGEFVSPMIFEHFTKRELNKLNPYFILYNCNDLNLMEKSLIRIKLFSYFFNSKFEGLIKDKIISKNRVARILLSRLIIIHENKLNENYIGSFEKIIDLILENPELKSFYSGFNDGNINFIFNYLNNFDNEFPASVLDKILCLKDNKLSYKSLNYCKNNFYIFNYCCKKTNCLKSPKEAKRLIFDNNQKISFEVFDYLMKASGIKFKDVIVNKNANVISGLFFSDIEKVVNLIKKEKCYDVVCLMVSKSIKWAGHFMSHNRSLEINKRLKFVLNSFKNDVDFSSILYDLSSSNIEDNHAKDLIDSILSHSIKDSDKRKFLYHLFRKHKTNLILHLLEREKFDFDKDICYKEYFRNLSALRLLHSDEFYKEFFKQTETIK